MPVLSYEDFRDALPAKGALLGLDPGSKIIGVAATDPGRLLATPARLNRSPPRDHGAVFSAFFALLIASFHAFGPQRVLIPGFANRAIGH